MLKTVKVKKKLKFVELLQWIKTNDIRGREFKDVNREYYFSVLEGGFFNFDEFTYDNDALYEFEVEEPITEDTTFERLVTLGCRGTINVHDDKSLSDLSGKKEYGAQVFALINGKLELIWEAE